MRRHPILSSNSLSLALGFSLLLHAGLFLSVRNVPDGGGAKAGDPQRLTLDVALVPRPMAPSPSPVEPAPLGPAPQPEAVEPVRPVDRAPDSPEETAEAKTAATGGADALEPEAGKSTARAAERTPEGAEPSPLAGGRKAGAPEGSETAGKPASPGAGASFSELARGLKLPVPAYPELARRWGYEGVTMVEITINADGRVRDVAVLRSSGHRILDDACVRVIRSKWRFRPMEREVRVKKEFAFELTR